MLNTFINSPLDQFEIKPLISFIVTPFYDLSFLSFTTFSLYSVILLLIIIGLYTLTLNNNIIKGSKWIISQEIIYDTLLNLLKSQIGGKQWGLYFPLIYTFFIFILIANLIGIIPYSFALLSQILFIIVLSFIVWLSVTLIGLFKHGLVFFSLFVPIGTPLILVPLLVLIELLSYLARAISLGLRLSANTFSGHLLIIILGGLLLKFISINLFYLLMGILPFILIIGIVILELAIAIIQAYVFTILTASYLKDALYLH